VSIAIASLTTCPQHVATLARWHHAEWAHLYSDWTLDVTTRELAAHAAGESREFTLVALDGERPLGSVSIVDVDAEEFAHYGAPWLASLYVHPDARRRGLGARLVRAAVGAAAAHSIVSLRLFTPAHRAFYERLGWTAFARDALHGVAVDLLQSRAVA
jgi:predicted N-acetyltransferase YhbS